MTFSDEQIIYVVFNCLYRYYYNPESSKEIAKIYQVCKMFKNSIDEKQEYLKSLYFIPKTKQELKTAVNQWCDDREGALLKYGDISLWITGKITDMSKLFQNKRNFNDCIKDWDTSAVIIMGHMFYDAFKFNQPLNNWNTSSVVYMEHMFHNAKSFNQPLNNWDTSSVISMNYMFCFAFKFNQGLNDWDTSYVTNIDSIFYNAKSFNQCLNDWDTSSVTNMSDMFNHSNMSVLPNWYTYIFKYIL
jgi:surface protein